MSDLQRSGVPATLLRSLDRFERSACSAAFFVLACLLIADVALREMLGQGLAWSRQAGLYANLVVSLFGMGLAASAGSHLRPRFADHWLPERWQPAMVRIGWLVTALAFLGFAALATQFVLETAAMEEQATVLRIPLWPVQALIPLAFAYCALRYLCYACSPQLAPDPS